MKKFFALMLLFVLNFTMLPAISATESVPTAHKQNGEERIEPNSKITLEFAEDFNVNESYVGSEVVFNLTNTIYDTDTTVIPKNTKFIGTVVSKSDSKWGFRRATAKINLNRMIFPDGTVYYISCVPEGSQIKSPAGLNVLKGLGISAFTGCVGMFGLTILAIECMSIGGILFAPATGAIVGVMFSVTSKGLNYKAHQGTKITFVLQNPIDIQIIDR